MRFSALLAPLGLGLVVLLVAALAVIQVRSQAEVARSLESQDNTSLGFLIDDLHRSNEALTQESLKLGERRDALKAGGPAAADAALRDEARKLRMLEGLDPVRGPGIQLVVDAPLNDIDIQDTLNNLRVAGAEAVAVGGRRVITGTPIRQAGTAVAIDGISVRGPWTFVAIGDPTRLSAAGERMTQALRAETRVRSAFYRVEADLTISAVVRPRPFVYGVAS
jgi:uncharacterized protein YlxW (UPF0749 family)